jgi:hypothetical protein
MQQFFKMIKIIPEIKEDKAQLEKFKKELYDFLNMTTVNGDKLSEPQSAFLNLISLSIN